MREGLIVVGLAILIIWGVFYLDLWLKEYFDEDSKF